MLEHLIRSYKDWRERRRLARIERENEHRRQRIISRRQYCFASLQSMRLDPRGAEFTLAGRLQKEYHWSAQETAEALSEYFKFMALVASTGEVLVPSADVDKVWRVHMLFSRQYMSGFCGTYLGKFVHRHSSTNIARDEAALAAGWERTLELYAETFAGQAISRYWCQRAAAFSKVESLPDKTVARSLVREHNAQRQNNPAASLQVTEHHGSSRSGPDLASMYLWYMVLMQPHYDSRACSHSASHSSEMGALASPAVEVSPQSSGNYGADSGNESYVSGGDNYSSGDSSSCSSSSCSSSSCSSSSCSSSY